MFKLVLVLLTLANGIFAHAEQKPQIEFAGTRTVQEDGTLVEVVMQKFSTKDECSSFISGKGPTTPEYAVALSLQTPQLSVRNLLVKRGLTPDACSDELKNHSRGFHCAPLNSLFCGTVGQAGATLVNGPGLYTSVRTEIVVDNKLKSEVVRESSDNVEYK